MAYRRTFCGLALTGLLSLSATGNATELFGVDFAGPATLFSVDQTNGSISPIGPVGEDDIGDLTSDTRAGSFRLWGVDINDNALVQIDPLTGALLSSVALDSRDAMTSIAFDVVTGRLFGNTTVAFGVAEPDTLYEIDPVTGTTSLIGEIGFDNVFALGFDQFGNLFGVADATNQLISISTLTGAGALIAGLQVGAAFDIASRPEDNTMFLADSGTGTFSLYTLDTTNGNLTGVGPYGSNTNIVGLAFSAVPEPGVLALFLAALPGIAALLGRRSGRRR